MTCNADCPCKNPDAPKYPSGKIFKNQRGDNLMVLSKEGRFPDAKYTILNTNSGAKSQHSYPALVRKERG